MEKEEIDYVSFSVANLLKEDGFDEWCDAFWSESPFIPDSTIEKYGELSDDGYFELTVQGGGDIPFYEVYSREPHLEFHNSKNSVDDGIYLNTTASAPMLYFAMKYIMRKYLIDVEVVIDKEGYYGSFFDLAKKSPLMKDVDEPYGIGPFKSRQDLMNNAIEYILTVKKSVDGYKEKTQKGC